MNDNKHDFSVDDFSWVVARDRRSQGSLKKQSVEALLLFEILSEVRAIRAALTPSPKKDDQHGR